MVDSVVSASPYGLSGPIGGATESTSSTVFAAPSMSRSSLATMKCWWNGAYVRSSTTVPYADRSSTFASGVVTIRPVARTSHSMLPSA